MKRILSLISIISIVLLVSCQSPQEDPMVLLDEKIETVTISESNGLGEMSTAILHAFTDKKSIKIFEKAITTAKYQPEKIDVSEPEYDVLVEYMANDEEVPTHGIHLWLGEENEKSTLMYIGDDELYLTTPKSTKQLRALLIKE